MKWFMTSSRPKVWAWIFSIYIEDYIDTIVISIYRSATAVVVATSSIEYMYEMFV